jgi:hypothetical protein
MIVAPGTNIVISSKAVVKHFLDMVNAGEQDGTVTPERDLISGTAVNSLSIFQWASPPSPFQDGSRVHWVLGKRRVQEVRDLVHAPTLPESEQREDAPCPYE